jgi:SpoVA protein.
MIVTIIFISCVLTGLGIFDKIAKHAGAGSFIPITGFANAMTSAALESKTEGIVLGIASNMFKLGGAVITFGIVAAYVMGVIRYVLFNG